MIGWSAGCPSGRVLPPWRERAEPVAADYGEAVAALNGETAGALRVGRDGVAILSVALPVQGYKRIVGALMLVSDTADIEASVRRVRIAILQVFAVALAITVLLSIYLAGTIARPVRRLAAAAEKVRHGHGRIAIPDFTRRRDEIGHLSHALRDMTEALYERLDAIEAFAADVVHEIRNPLSSLRSAIESLEKVGDDERRSRLTAVIKDDVARLDRLIGEISRASRLDAELSRAEFAAVDIGGLLSALVEVHDAAGKPNIVRLETEIAGGDLIVNGIEERLAQVAENLVGNADLVQFAGRNGAATWISRRRLGVHRRRGRGPRDPGERAGDDLRAFLHRAPGRGGRGGPLRAGAEHRAAHRRSARRHPIGREPARRRGTRPGSTVRGRASRLSRPSPLPASARRAI